MVCKICGAKIKDNERSYGCYDGRICKRCYIRADLVECYDCGVLVLKSEAEMLDNKYFCPDCIEHFALCSYCGGLVDLDSNYYSTDEYEILCEDCYMDLYHECYNCGDSILMDDAYRGADDEIYCEDCFYDRFTYCNNCGEAIYLDEAYYDGNGNYYCERCYEGVSAIRPYEYKPDPVFHKLDYENTLYFGFELEVECEEDPEVAAEELTDLNGLLYFKHDGSLQNGFEIVSHPITWKFNNKKKIIYNLLKAIREIGGITSYEDGTCGLHIHLDHEYISTKTYKKMALFIYNNWEKMIRFSKRGDNDPQYARYTEYTLDDYVGGYNPFNDRHNAINERFSTIEIRIFRGTLNHYRLIASIQFCNALAEYCQNVSALSMKWDKFVDWLKVDNKYQHLVRYFKKEGLCA
ncbi:MAG: amidoligase family protein [Promethearchaeota archaeon]